MHGSLGWKQPPHGGVAARRRRLRLRDDGGGIVSGADVAGWSAAALTMCTFVCQDMRRLRVLAICANVAFVSYGALAGLTPVLALHLLLAPVNVWRLLQLRLGAAAVRAAPVSAGPAQPAAGCALARQWAPTSRRRAQRRPFAGRTWSLMPQARQATGDPGVRLSARYSRRGRTR